MRTGIHQANKFLRLLLGTFLFASVICLAADCNAQRQRGWLMRSNRVQQQPPVQQDARIQPAASVQNGTVVQNGFVVQNEENQYDQRPFETRNQQGQVNNGNRSPRYRYLKAPRFLESRFTRYQSSSEAYPKYIGAFHYSHYSNLGVPSGDLGFRGNGIYWSPW